MRYLLILFNFLIFGIPIILQVLICAFLFKMSKLLRFPLGQRTFFKMLVALDQQGNVVFLGDEDETISSRVGRANQNPNASQTVRILAKLINSLFPHQENHVEESIEKDEINPDEDLILK